RGCERVREAARAVRDALLSGHRRILVLDRDRLDTALAERRQERTPPRGAVTATDRCESPRGASIHRVPAAVQQSVQIEFVGAEDDVLGMRMSDPRQRSGDGEGIHLLPEEMAGIEGHGQLPRDRGELFKRLDVVHTRPRMELDADQEVRMLTVDELRELRPVRRQRVLPLPFVDADEVGKPTTSIEINYS